MLRISHDNIGFFMFQILLTKMNHTPSTVRLIVKTCCFLHNLMRIRYPTMHNALVDREDRRGHLVPGKWRKCRNLYDIRNANIRGNNKSNKAGKIARNTLKHQVNSPAGNVPWQDQIVPYQRLKHKIYTFIISLIKRHQV